MRLTDFLPLDAVQRMNIVRQRSGRRKDIAAQRTRPRPSYPFQTEEHRREDGPEPNTAATSGERPEIQ